jgi:hypothetical protein
VSQERLAHLIHDQSAAIAVQTQRLHTYEAIRRILRVLALEEITLGQAIGILSETVEHVTDPEQQRAYQQAIASLRQMQADEQ